MILREVEIGAADPGALGAFYGERLGLDVRRESGGVAVALGPTRLRIVRRPDAGIHHFAVNVPEASLDRAHRWLAARTPLLADSGGRERFDFRDWDAEALYFRDPAGNVGELIARRAVGGGPAGAFGPGHLLALSEIGLVARDVPALARRLRRRTGLEVFRGSEGESFTALGDDHGLLIVVREGRDWYPTVGGAARLQPVRVTLETDDGRSVRIAGASCRIRG